jgi:hypothetical protein
MAFQGDFTPVLAKHSRSFSLVDALSVGVDRMQRDFDPMRLQIEGWRKSQLTDVAARSLGGLSGYPPASPIRYGSVPSASTPSVSGLFFLRLLSRLLFGLVARCDFHGPFVGVVALNAYWSPGAKQDGFGSAQMAFLHGKSLSSCGGLYPQKRGE